MKPTESLISKIQLAYDHFNEDLFEGKLPDVILTAQRINKTMGYFSADRWAGKDGETRHEIAINPEYVANSAMIEMLQTIAHEQAHLFQHVYGSPSRKSYHNSEWSELMEGIGLMPSDTGAPGGKRTGQKMADYPIEGGKFLKSCENLIKKKNFHLPYIDRRAKPSSSYIQQAGEEVNEQIFEGLDEEVIAALARPVDEDFDCEMIEPLTINISKPSKINITVRLVIQMSGENLT